MFKITELVFVRFQCINKLLSHIFETVIFMMHILKNNYANNWHVRLYFPFSPFQNLLIQINMQSYRKESLQTSGFRHKYACTECEKRYTTKGHLNQHMQLHTGQFSFYCNECGKGFSHGDHYKDHVRAHKGIKYHCEYCSKPFMTRQAYRKHRSLHES